MQPERRGSNAVNSILPAIDVGQQRPQRRHKRADPPGAAERGVPPPIGSGALSCALQQATAIPGLDYSLGSPLREK